MEALKSEILCKEIHKLTMDITDQQVEEEIMKQKQLYFEPDNTHIDGFKYIREICECMKCKKVPFE